MVDRLLQSNPWWSLPGAIREDPVLLRRARARLRWTPRLVEDLDLTLPAVYTIRGPRQVGKTTAVKLMIERSLDLSQDGVLYHSFDLETEPQAIIDVVQSARRFRPRIRRWRFFLDEVSGVRGWQKAVKWLRDNTPAGGDTFVLTGSSSLDIEAGSERLPGRRGPGTGHDRILLPLSFSDFAGLHGIEAPTVLRAADFLSGRSHEVLLDARLRLSALQALFERYLRVGGFPAAVEWEAVGGGLQDETIEMLWDMISAEVGRQGREPARAFRMLEQIVRSLGSRTNWTALGQVMDASRAAAEEYATLLARTFTIVIVYRYLLDRGGPNPSAEKKIYCVDPAFAYLPGRVRRVGLIPDIPGLVENAVMMALFRTEERPLAEQFALPQALFYWRSASGGEVDALAGEGAIKRRVPVEVKYQRSIDRRSIAPMRRAFGKGIVVTRDHLDLDDPALPFVPAAIFLWLLGGETVAGRG